MFTFIKKYWDIICGILSGGLLAFIAKFELNTVQLVYSVLILMLLCIGVLRIIKQEIEKKHRKKTVIDTLVDGQKPIKAVHIVQEPYTEGERVGYFILIIYKGVKSMWEKFKLFWSKFKGYLLTIALTILTIIEMCGDFINSAFGGALVIDGVKILPLITLICAVGVGIISNGYTKEQREKIKALFSKSPTNELVTAEIKKTIKEKSAQLLQFNKVLATQQHQLSNLESELETLNNTLQAKIEMNAMTPQLASDADVQLARNEVGACNAKIETANEEINTTKANIEVLITTISTLKSQLP